MPLTEIRRITTDDPLYEQERALREEVLLRPLGLDLTKFDAAFPGVESRFEHFVAVVEHQKGPRVVGCATLLSGEQEAGVGQLMQMAVDGQRQGEGIGRRLVAAVEARAFGGAPGGHGLGRLCCHSRVEAAPFYEALGWRREGDVFEEVGIPHVTLVVDRPAAPVERPWARGM